MKIQLTEWGARNYSPAPSIRILRLWASSGQLYPAPEKVGHEWMVDEHAIRVAVPEVADSNSASDRVRNILRTV